jgi:hypothetical protein
MGAIFRPKYKDRHGVIRESDVWWVRFRQHGKTVRQSTETDSETKARAFLRERSGKVALRRGCSGKRAPVWPPRDWVRASGEVRRRSGKVAALPR